MTARLLDTLNDIEFGKDPLADAVEAPAKQAEPTKAAAPQATEIEIPEPYRGKSAADLVEIIRAKEAMIGRQSQDVGSARAEAAAARAMLDKALEFGTRTGRPDVNAEAKAFGRDDLLDRPQEVVKSLVQDELRGTKDEIATMRQNNQAAYFAQLHPSAKDDLNDPKFVEWFNANQYRQKIAAKVFADPSKTDWEAADELWSGYEASRTAPVTKPEPTKMADTPQKPNPSTSVDDVSLMKGGSGGGGAQNDPANAGKETFRASKLMKMQADDPDTYWSIPVQRRINAGVVIDDL